MTATTAPSAVQELQQLRDELAELPARIEEATEQGDETLLAKLLVRDRVLERLIAKAETRSFEERRERLLATRRQREQEFAEAISGIDDLRLAADVYARAAEARRQRAEPLRQMLNGIDRQLWKLEEQR